jgi:hypothetical protein
MDALALRGGESAGPVDKHPFVGAVVAAASEVPVVHDLETLLGCSSAVAMYEIRWRDGAQSVESYPGRREQQRVPAGGRR